MELNLKERQKRLKEKQQYWAKEKILLMQQQDLNEDIKLTKNRKKPTKEQRKALTTTKFLMIFLFCSCSAVEAFTMFAIIHGMNMGYGIDFGPLTMLITAVVAEVISFSIYSLKSMKENTKGGIVYETAMHHSTSSIEQSIPIKSQDQEEEIVG